SGPTGPGTLYQIAYSDTQCAQPVTAWAASPRELRVAFDRPLDPGALRAVARGTTLTAGRSVAAGGRFGTLRPGHGVVMAQRGDPRTSLAVHSVQMSPDRRTLILATDPQTDAVTYTLMLPGMGRPPRATVSPTSAERPQEPAIDTAYELTGVQAEWHPAAPGAGDSAAAWQGWLPHLD